MSHHRARVKSEQKFEYKCKSDNKSRRFTPVRDELVVTFEATGSEDVAESLWSRDDCALDAVSPDRGYAVLRVGEDRVSGLSDELEAAEEIANILPVMQDHEGCRRYFIPDELTVQFADGVSNKDAEAILGRAGMDILVKQRTHGYFTVAVPEGQGLFESLGTCGPLTRIRRQHQLL